MTKQIATFSHNRLDVYDAAIALSRWVYKATQTFPRGRAHLKDQLIRTSDSIVLNIAEGAQQSAPAMRKKHYRIALGSAAEASAALDLIAIIGTIDTNDAQVLVNRIGKMLNSLAR